MQETAIQIIQKTEIYTNDALTAIEIKCFPFLIGTNTQASLLSKVELKVWPRQKKLRMCAKGDFAKQPRRLNTKLVDV